LALAGIQLEHGSEVVTSPFTFIAAAEALHRVGARVVFADIDLLDFSLSVDATDAAVTARTVGILPVHLFGSPCDIQNILAIAESRDLFVLEDAAQALGARWNGKRIGSFGVAGAASFFPSKPLGGMGDGGAVLTNSSELAKRVRSLRVHGARSMYVYDRFGTNSRLDELQAALLQVKLPQIDKYAISRRRIAAIFGNALAGNEWIRPLGGRPYGESVYSAYTVSVPRGRDELANHLRARRISTAVYYPKPLHLQPVFASLGYRVGSLPNAERASATTLSIPIFAGMPDQWINRVIEGLLTWRPPTRGG